MRGNEKEREGVAITLYSQALREMKSNCNRLWLITGIHAQLVIPFPHEQLIDLTHARCVCINQSMFLMLIFKFAHKENAENSGKRGKVNGSIKPNAKKLAN